jgi:hypothetical protein
VTIQTIPKRFKFAKGVIWLFLALSVLLLGYIYLRAFSQGITTLHSFLNHSLLKYSVVSLIGVIFWGVVLRLQDRIKFNIAVMTTSLIMGCYAVEVALEFLTPIESGSDDPRYNTEGVKFDTRNKIEVWLDLKGDGVDALPWVAVRNFTLNNGIPDANPPLIPFSNVSKKTLVHCNESGTFSTWLSDRYGFRNPDSEWDAPQTEWLVTGGSFTIGSCVNSGEDFGGQIRLLSRESVLNLGVGGAGMLPALASLREYAVFKKPKIVIWVFFEDFDLLALEEEVRSPLLMSYLKPEFSQRLIYRQVEIDNRLNQYILNAKVAYEKNKEKLLIAMDHGYDGWSYFLQKTRMLRLFNIRRRLGADTVPQTFTVRPLFSEILTQARDQVSSWGGKLYFAYLPAFQRYQLNMKYSGIYKRESNVVNAVKSLNIPIINLHKEFFANHPDPLSLFPFRNNGHYTSEGYSGVAKAIVLGVKGKQRKNVFYFDSKSGLESYGIDRNPLTSKSRSINTQF